MADSELYLRYKCEQGLRKKGLTDNAIYRDRLEYELKVIIDMRFSDYFLVVCDILEFCRVSSIPRGPGRGSVGGSLVAYLLGITALDPITYGLVFERFLNPARVSMPDVDMDFCEVRRDEVIEYVRQRYGADCVAHIGTFGKAQAKGAIKDVARTLGYDYEVGDKLAKLVLPPIEGKPQSLATCFEKVDLLSKYYRAEGSVEQKVLRWAEKLEGRIRSQGVHASGIIVADKPVWNYLPLYNGKSKEPTSQFEMYTVEEVGLVKFDFLGLRALTTIDRCLDLVEEHTGARPDIHNIPVDDPEVYKLFSQGTLDGVFQFEGSSGIRDLAVRAAPTTLENLADLNALYRPGPLKAGMVEQYLRVRAGQTDPQYLLDELKPILSPTAGVLIYQEQILLICRQLAGYSMAEADLMRKAIGKKKAEDMEKQRIKFAAGMAEQGFPEEMARKLFSEIETFAGYGFNKCIAGDTVIYRGSVRAGSKHPTIAHLYKLKNEASYAEKHKQTALKKKLQLRGYGQILALDGDSRIRPRTIKDIVFSGTKPVYEICLANGMKVKATAEHRFFSKEGWVSIVAGLEIGSELIVDAGYEVNNKSYSFSDKGNAWKCRPYATPKTGFPEGANNPAYTNGSFSEWKKVRELLAEISYCEWCGKEHRRLELAHIDGDRANSTRENIAKLCPSCHKRHDYAINGRKGKWSKGHATDTSQVVSIIPVGEEETYDIEMDSAEHNYIANGFVSSNSHAILYSYISYQMAWLKAYYPTEFMCACLTSDSDENEKVIKYLEHCKHLGIKILPPDVNESTHEFSVSKNRKSIRFGLGAVKNVGAGPISLIVEERKTQAYTDLIDFISRESLERINRRQLESLIYAGAFDTLEPIRAKAIDTVELSWNFREDIKRYNSKMETFRKRQKAWKVREQERAAGVKKAALKVPGEPERPQYPASTITEDFPIHEKLEKEHELVGFYISGHPLDAVVHRKGEACLTIEEIRDAGAIKNVFVMAIPSIIKEITTKGKKELMAFLTLEDRTGTIEAMAAPKVWDEYKELVRVGLPVVFKCSAETVENDDAKVVKLRVRAIGAIAGAEPPKKQEPVPTVEKVDEIVVRSADELYKMAVEIVEQKKSSGLRAELRGVVLDFSKVPQ